MAWKPDYITGTQLGDYMRIDDDVDDVQLAIAATTASRAVDHHCNRQFGLVDAPELRLYTAWFDPDRCRWVVDVDDLMTTTGAAFEVADVGVLTDYRLEPANAAAEGKPWTRLVVKPSSSVRPTGEEYEIEGTARWGWTTVPTPVVQGSKLQGSRFHSRRDSPYGVTGSPDQGGELRLLSKLDPDVAVSLRNYVRPRRVA